MSGTDTHQTRKGENIFTAGAVMADAPAYFRNFGARFEST
jgi:hypothetical protein